MYSRGCPCFELAAEGVKPFGFVAGNRRWHGGAEVVWIAMRKTFARGVIAGGASF